LDTDQLGLEATVQTYVMVVFGLDLGRVAGYPEMFHSFS
jgi:hypothetical protein